MKLKSKINWDKKINYNNILFYYAALNRPDAKDTDIEMLRDVVVDSLFSVLVSLGQLFVSLIH